MNHSRRFHHRLAPARTPLSINDGLGCLTVIVVFLVCSAVGSLFATGEGDIWKVTAAVALVILGLGVVWVCAKYRS